MSGHWATGRLGEWRDRESGFSLVEWCGGLVSGQCLSGHSGGLVVVTGER